MRSQADRTILGMDKYDWWGLLFLLGCLITAYTSTLTHTYGYLDDYSIERFATKPPFNWIENRFHRDGRFLAGLALLNLYPLMPGTQYFVIARILSQVSLILLGLLTAKCLRKAGLGPIWAYGCAAFILLSPTQALFASWSMTFAFPTGAICALLGGMLVRSGWETDASPERYLKFAMSGLLLLASLHIYQTFFGYFFLPLAAHTFEGKKDRSFWRRWMATGLIAGLVCTLYLGTVLAAKAWLLEPHPHLQRTNFSTDPVDRLRYLWETIHQAVLLWAHWVPPFAQLLTVAFVGASVVGAIFHRSWKDAMGRGFIVLTLCFAGGLPLYLSAEREVSFRATPLVYVGIAFCLGQSLHRIERRCPKRTVGAHLILGAGIFGMLAGARTLTWEGIVKPSTRDYAFFSEAVRTELETKPEVVFYDPVSHPELSELKYARKGEFGLVFGIWPYVEWGPIPQSIWEQFGDPSAPWEEQAKRTSTEPYPVHDVDPAKDFLPFPLIGASQKNSDQDGTVRRIHVRDEILGEVEWIYTQFIYSRELGLAYLTNAQVDYASASIIPTNNKPYRTLWSYHLGSFAVRRAEDDTLEIFFEEAGPSWRLERAIGNEWSLSGPNGPETWVFHPDRSLSKSAPGERSETP